MPVQLIVVGETNVDFVKLGLEFYIKRLLKYTKFNIVTVQGAKLSNPDYGKQKEGDAILKALKETDTLVLLDEKGHTFTSEAFAQKLQQYFNQASGNICFVIGGAYGFSPEVYKRANHIIALSKFTFPHQLVRLVFIEQLYRAFSILNNDPYHHQ
jgi:23S rRNA (pseudouridine1915-N3)-methyltransferase